MTFNISLCCIILSVLLSTGELPFPSQQDSANLPLQTKVEQFELQDAIMRDGVAELSSKGVDGLHLGFEEIIRNKIQDDPRRMSVHFSIQVRDKTVQQILDALCQSDPHYAWSQDGASINIYPKAVSDDPSYLLNLAIKQIRVTNVPDPDQALTPLAKLFPEQQIGYMGAGGDDSYPEPWTAAFGQISVRQFINRIAEHMGSRTLWIWQGGEGERMFTFVKGAFHTFRAKPA